MSDLGSNLISGAKIVTDYLKDVETQQFFLDNNIKPLTFSHYDKGRNELGSLVESCVAISKQLIFKSIGHNILDYFDFEYVICNAVHLINRRPISFKESLRDCLKDGIVPTPITPEILIHGHELISLNLLPGLHPNESNSSDPDFDVNPNKLVKDGYNKLRKARNLLVKTYYDEFLSNLIQQATDKQGRYAKKNHVPIVPGDIVLLKEQFQKPINYSMGIIKEVAYNDIGEGVSCKVFKGSTRELVQRHISSLIPVISRDDDTSTTNDISFPTLTDYNQRHRPKRKAASLACKRNKALANKALV